MKEVFTLLFLLFNVVEGNEEKTFHLAHDGKALNLTASYQTKRSKEHQCLTDCLHKLKCEALNVEEIQKNEEYICHLFLVDKCYVPNYKKYIVDAQNFKFYRTRQKTDCLSLRDAGVIKSGIFTIWPDGITKMNAYCDMETSLGGWTVAMRRIDDQQLFNKSWVEYENGFGTLTGSFWFGNENMHLLTQHCMYEAKMEHVTESDDIIEANYLQFRVHSKREMYRLHLQEFYSPEHSTDVYMLFNHNQKFSTYDKDNDEHVDSCSKLNGYGGFWFAACHHGYMTGVYMDEFPNGNTYGNVTRIKRSSIKIRRMNVLSQGKPSSMSSKTSTAGNDGKTSTMFHTHSDDNAWWEVDLKQKSYISGIRIINRFSLKTDVRKRFLSFNVTTQIKESDQPKKCFSMESDKERSALLFEFTCTEETFARYVRVTQYILANPLHLQEIQIFGNEFIKQK